MKEDATVSTESTVREQLQAAAYSPPTTAPDKRAPSVFSPLTIQLTDLCFPGGLRRSQQQLV